MKDNDNTVTGITRARVLVRGGNGARGVHSRQAARSSVMAALVAAFAAGWGSPSAAQPQGAVASSALRTPGAVAGPELVAARPELAELAVSCETGDAVSCNDLGVVSLDGYGTPGDVHAAFRAFQRACNNGSADGCGNLGALYESGAGAHASVDQAARLYERACKQGGALGCSNLGALYARGLGVPRNLAAAQRYFAFACERGSAAGCSNLMELELPRSSRNATLPSAR